MHQLIHDSSKMQADGKNTHMLDHSSLLLCWRNQICHTGPDGSILNLISHFQGPIRQNKALKMTDKVQSTTIRTDMANSIFPTCTSLPTLCTRQTTFICDFHISHPTPTTEGLLPYGSRFLGPLTVHLCMHDCLQGHL
jgi:hypothetical protein